MYDAFCDSFTSHPVGSDAESRALDKTVSTDFTRAQNTLILSDIHLADEEPPHPTNPLWKLFKNRKHFIDKDFENLLEYAEKIIPEPIELVLNGDIFDFDGVGAIPKDAPFETTWLERARGLAAEELKSRYKISVILKDHEIWVNALRKFVSRGNRVVFITGNHDMELHWPLVREEILTKLDPSKSYQDHIRFCEWFYISNQDTLIEHGNQYDEYCLSANPINPLIKKSKNATVRLPFGNLAGRYMLNGMGLMNPHAESSFIKSSISEYIVFYYKYMIKTQPFLLLTWFWSALVTLLVSLAEGFLPALSDPLTIHTRVEDIARRSNSTQSQVWALKELHVHPAIFNPFKILRELWLDRAILLGIIVFGSFQFFVFMNIFASISIWWFVALVVLLMPIFIFYAHSIESDVQKVQKAAFNMAPVAAQIAGVRRVVQGHTHCKVHTFIEKVEYLNTGTWSPAYHDVECTQPFGQKCFALIRPSVDVTKRERIAELFEWKENTAELISPSPAA